MYTNLHRNQTNFNDAQRLSYLRKIDPYVFEELILISFKNNGYHIKRNKRYSKDGGIDGIIFDSNKNKIAIQAKRYSTSITPKHILDFTTAIKKCKAHKGLFIHTGRTGPKSYQNLSENITKDI